MAEGRVKVASAQVSVTDNDIMANREAAMAMACRITAEEKGVDLILFHEAFLESGTDFATLDKAMTDENLEFWKGVARECGTNVLAGRLERTEDGKLHNKATVVTPKGEVLADYSKCFLFCSERDTMEPGDHLSIFELNGMKFGIMICADFGFPELSRKYAEHGVDALLVSSSWAYPDDDLWEICNRARSSENGIYCVSVDRVGPTSKGLVKVGRSMCCDPNGFVVANLAEVPDTYFACNLYKEQVEKRRGELLWLDWLRPEFIASL